MDVVKCSWSGGKDSSCATDLHLKQGDKCIVVNYIPMFNDTIPLLLKEHYEFIINTIEYWKSLGALVYQVSGISYVDYVLKVSKKN